jgi:hypothetical protein
VTKRDTTFTSPGRPTRRSHVYQKLHNCTACSEAAGPPSTRNDEKEPHPFGVADLPCACRSCPTLTYLCCAQYPQSGHRDSDSGVSGLPCPAQRERPWLSDSFNALFSALRTCYCLLPNTVHSPHFAHHDGYRSCYPTDAGQSRPCADRTSLVRLQAAVIEQQLSQEVTC